MKSPPQFAVTVLAIAAAHAGVLVFSLPDSPISLPWTTGSSPAPRDDAPGDYPLMIPGEEVIQIPQLDPTYTGEVISGTAESLFPEGAAEAALRDVERAFPAENTHGSSGGQATPATPADHEGPFDVTDLADATQSTYEPKIPSPYDEFSPFDQSDDALAAALKRHEEERQGISRSPEKTAPPSPGSRAFRPVQ